MPWCGACTRALGAVMESASWARGWRDCKQVRALSVSRVVPPFLFAVVMGVFLLLSVVQVPRRRGQQSVLCRRLSMDIDCQCHCTTRDSCFLCVCSYRVSVGALSCVACMVSKHQCCSTRLEQVEKGMDKRVRSKENMRTELEHDGALARPPQPCHKAHQSRMARCTQAPRR